MAETAEMVKKVTDSITVPPAIFKNGREVIKGIKLDGHEIKKLQLPDDTSLIVGSPDSIKPIFYIIKSFQSLSGLTANIEKTKFQNIGLVDFSKESMKRFEFSKGKMELLGIMITKDDSENENTNFAPRVKTI